MKLSFFLARRLLFGRKRKTTSKGVFFSFFGVFLASTFVLISLGILGGYQHAYREAMMSFNAHVIISAPKGLFEEDQTLIRDHLNFLQKKFPHQASPYLYYETLMPTLKGMKPLILKGIDFSSRQETYPFLFETFPSVSHEKDKLIFVGEGILKHQKDLEQTKNLKALSLKNQKGGSSSSYENIQIDGFFKSGLYHYDSQYVLLDYRELQNRYYQSPLIHGVEIRLKDSESIDDFVKNFQEKFGGSFFITTWKDLNSGLLEVLQLEKTTIFVIVILITLIACLNVFGFNFLFFTSRVREFHILSLLGFSKQKIHGVLNLLSVCLGMMATILACFCALFVLFFLSQGRGVPLDPEVYYVDRVPVTFKVFWFVAFLLGAWLLCYLSSLAAGKVMIKRYLGQTV